MPPSEVASGLERLGASTVEGLGGRLENIALLIGTGGESAVSKAAALIFASQQFADLPEQVQNAVRVLKDPEASKADKIEAAGQPAVSGLITAGLLRSGLRETPRRIAPPTPFIPEARPVGIPGRRMVVPPPGMATLEQAEAFRRAGQPIRRPLEEVRVPPEAPQGQPTFAPSGLGRPEPPAFTPALEVPPTPPGQRRIAPAPAATGLTLEEFIAQRIRGVQADLGRTLSPREIENEVNFFRKGNGEVEQEVRRNGWEALNESDLQFLAPNQRAVYDEWVKAGKPKDVGKEGPEPPEPPAPAGEPAPLPPKPSAGGPEIAFTPEKSGGKDLLGNPLGTKYYSTPEDWAAWKKIQADKAIARELGQPAALALGFAKNEALKNGKYGGSVPLPPKGTTDPLITMYHGEGGVGGAGTDTRFFTRDPQQAARYGPNITQVEIPESEVEAFEAARQAKGIGTPGAILTQEYVKRATPMANPPAAPVTEIEAPAAAPAKLVAAAYMPEGATVPETGPHHPGILKRLGIKGFETPESRNTPQFGFVDANGVFHTREESAEIAKATGQDLKEFEEGEPAHSDEIESPTQPGVPISETKPPVPETKAAVPETKPPPAATPEPPSISFEQPEPASAEAKRITDQADTAIKEEDELSEKLRAVQADRDRAGYGTKRRDALDARVDKLRNQLDELQKNNSAVKEASRDLYLEKLAREGHWSQKWGATVALLERRADRLEKQRQAAQAAGDRKAADDLFYKERALGAQRREISDQGYKAMQAEASRQLQELGATKEEADLEAGQIANMQMSYPGMKSMQEVSFRMRTIEAQRLKEQMQSKADALMAEFGILHSDSLRRRLETALPDEKRANEVLEEFRQQWQADKDEQARKAKADEEAARKREQESIETAKQLAKEGKLGWVRRGTKESQHWVPVEAKPVTLSAAPNHEFFTHHAGVAQWIVTEAKTGLMINEGRTKTAAIENANARIAEVGAKQFDEMVKRGQEGAPPKPDISNVPKKGIIVGSDVEKWADSVIKKSGKRLRSGLDPELAAAGVVKGVAFLERGITEFAKWSAEMIKAFGEAIRPHLTNLYEQAKEARAEAFRQSSAEPARKAETPSLPKGPQPPPSPPASPVQPEAAAAPQGEPTHGIAARVTAAAAQQGIIAPVEPGEGIAAAESVEHGRQLLNQGANPQAVLDEFNRTKSVSADGMAVVRAHGERLRKAARDAANKFGITSDQYDAAWKSDSDWTKAIKPMQTEWHKIGQAQQGEVEIDTGTFHGLRSAFFEATGRDFTPDQKAAAEKIAKGVKDAQDAADKAKDDAFKQIDKEAPKVEAQPIPAPARKPGAKRPPVAQPTTKQVWNRAKVIIDGGETDFDDVRHKLAIEFGLPVDEITRILAEPKAVRTVTDDMYRKMAERRRLVQQAKNWLKDQQVPGWYRFIRNIPRVFFIDKVFGHGTVGMITHGGLNIFNPPAWKTYWPNFLRQYKLMVDPGYHERMMQDLVRDPLFTRARRAGLANDPFRYQDDYQTPGMGAWLGKLGLAGNRGFDSLKLFRQARFNQIWNDLPPALRNPVHAKLVADAVNHATGVVKTSFGGEWANWTFFAPKLEGSRWAWMIGDPLKASTTFLDWGNASPEAREAAMAQLKEKAYIAGTYFGLLALNQGILAASGSKDQVNFTNPRRSDFLSFKAEGHNIGIVGPMLGMVRLFANMLHASMGKRGKLESLQSRADEMGATVADYARGKLSPFAGFGVDLATQSDFQGRPLPFSSDRVPAYLRKQGIKKYTYGEYAAQEFTPIPVSEAVREVWRAQGMNESEINRYLDALLVGVVAGGTGARISVATPQKKALP